jgi:hypothetical protein
MKSILCLVAALIAAVGTAAAQSSASYKLTEFAFNAGGDPMGGSFAASASYRIKLDAIGDGLIGAGLSSTSFKLGAGFVDDYPPPGEVRNVHWSDATTLLWDPEPSVGSYDLYRDFFSTLPGSFGSCFQASIGSETWTDGTNPAIGTGWFYLVTAKNRLYEEGTKGFQSNNSERGNPAPCP